MDVDKLFKLPSLPSSAVNKRKWKEPSETDALKAAVTSSRSDEERRGAAQPSKVARVEDVADDGLAEEDETHFSEDEDEEGGRFFGGGLTDEQARILDIMDRGDASDAGQLLAASATPDIPTIRKQLLRFEKGINRNAEMRAKYADDPVRFIDSEVDLDSEIKALVVLTTDPSLLYPEFARLGGAASLAGLLSHDNADIAASVIEVLEELTDDDVLDADVAEHNQDEAGADPTKGIEAMNVLVASLLEQSLLELLVSNLARFDDQVDPKLDDQEVALRRAEIEGDAQAIYHTLGLLENLLSLQPSFAETLGSSASFLTWILQRISRKGAPDQNTSYAAELLAILMQNSESNRTRLGTTDVNGENGIDALLRILSRLRRAEPDGAEEEEYMENVLDALCSVLSVAANKKLFLDGEGVELMVLLMKEKKSLGRLRALKVLDHAMSGPAGSATSLRLVEAAGLGPLFMLLMEGEGGGRKRKKGATAEDLEHLLGALASLFTHLPSDSIPRVRLLAKFVTDSYEKVDRLVELRDAVVGRLDAAIALDFDGDERYLARLEAGLFSLQLLDTILAWLIMEDDAVADHLAMLLRRRSLGFRDILATLQEYHDNLGDQVSASGEEGQDLLTKDILAALMQYIAGIV